MITTTTPRPASRTARKAPERKRGSSPIENNGLTVANPNRILIYSHDTFGLGNIRRVISICEYLKHQIPSVSALVLTGSPMLHSFRLIQGIDYVKLPCIKRDLSGNIGVKYLNFDMESTLRLRRELIRSTITNFKPDVLIVDKKPGGVAGELVEGLGALKSVSSEASVVLLLRDILDDAAATIEQWRRQGAYELIEQFYDKILVVGVPELYDVREEYQFPPALRAKVEFCGYVRREATGNRNTIRRELRIGESDRLVLVTAGGGEDGYALLRNYLEGAARRRNSVTWKSVIVTGPELAEPHKYEIQRLKNACPGTQVIEFTDQMMNYLHSADVVVSMGGYNTICEILSLRKRAVIVPRIQPVQEQKIRAERMAGLGLFKMIHPAEMTPDALIETVESEMKAYHTCPSVPASLDLNGLPRISSIIQELVRHPKKAGLRSVPALMGR